MKNLSISSGGIGNIGKILLMALTEEQVMEYYQRWRDRQDPVAFKELYKHFEPMIIQTVNKWNTNLNPATLKSHGKVQLIKALKSYNPQKGTALSTHVYNYLQKLSRISMYYGEAVRMPENIRLKVGSYLAAVEALREKLHREPTVNEIAEELGWSKKEVERIQNYLYSEGTESGAETPYAFDQYTGQGALLEAFYNSLPAEEQLVFEHLTGYGGKPLLKPGEIAKKMGWSPAKVSLIRKRITEKAQKWFGGNINGEQ
jgi:DNA-directed RNA polymerase specialized sigma subunit